MAFSKIFSTPMFYLAIVLAVIIIIFELKKSFSKKITNSVETFETLEVTKPSEIPEIMVDIAEEEFSSGTLKLKDVDEPTAAMIMAIVSNESGIPLSELIFKSIRQIAA